jgi:hypothetical protein
MSRTFQLHFEELMDRAARWPGEGVKVKWFRKLGRTFLPAA